MVVVEVVYFVGVDGCGGENAGGEQEECRL